MSDALEHDDDALESLVGQVADEFLRRLQRGESPEVAEYEARYPDAAPLLRNVLASLRLFDPPEGPHAAALDLAAEGPATGTLGDFRLLREVGRGGMGIVYEAEQISLGRRVALKVLPFAATLDGRQLQRFKNEAQAAAQLHHPNIVPVYSVGCERGVHYYAMQFIEGQTLAALVEELRGAGAGDRAVSTRPYPPEPLQRYPQPQGRLGKSTTPLGDPSTDRSTVDLAHVRTVARLGIQAADALDHAHQVGIIHRDIKPSNLLLDGRGNVWVTDFGLAHCQSDVSLTLTGDLIGTLRYMSPEQARAGRLPLDHRTDIYSLGATLYELLTLRPVVDGKDREEILARILSEEPSPLRRHNRALPRELEVIVHKALARAAEERYATAGEMADDLRRFLDDRPIRARPPGAGRRLFKWARRHRALVGSAAVLLAVVLSLAGGLLGWLGQRRAAAAAAATEYLHRAELLQEQGHWDEAREALTRADERLAPDGPEALRHRVHRLRDDLDWVVDLEEAQSLAAETREELTGDYAGAERAYRRAFTRRGLDVESMAADEAAGRIRALSIRAPLIHALDDWAFARERMRRGDGERLMAVAGRADDDPWRQKLRDLRPWDDRAALERLASDPAALDQPAAELVIVSLNLDRRGGAAAAERLLRQAQARRPGDFWLNFVLANVLAAGPQAQDRLAQSVGFYRAALVMRSNNSAVHLNLGVALGILGRQGEAEQEFRKVLELRGEFAPAYSNLGHVLAKQKRVAEAEAACRKAIALQPDYPEAHNNLGNVLAEQGQLAAAEAELRRALAIRPDHPEAHFSLGTVLGRQGKASEAEKAFRAAVKLRPESAEAHCNLGLACQQQGKLDDALAAERRAIALRPNYPEAWFNLANVLVARRELGEAEDALRRAIALRPNFAAALFNLGLLLQDRGRPEEAEQAFRKAIAAQPSHVRSYLALAWNLKGREQFAAAVRCYQEAFAADAALAGNSENGIRFLAACYAARAGCGQGRDAGTLDDAVRARLRRQALDWLRADLHDGRRRIESDPEKSRPAIAQRMRQWLKEPALDGVRRREALEGLPENERRDWQRFWQEVEQLSRIDPGERPT